MKHQQEYCDWCFASLTADDRRRSTEVGLPAEQAWACTRCIDSRRIQLPPEGWNGGAFKWPFKRRGTAG